MNTLIFTFNMNSARFHMRILKILLILLVPALGFVSCKKSELKPCNHAPAAAQTNSGNTTTSDVVPVNSRLMSPSNADITVTDGNGGTDVLGSGDDDRDGGDKKKKR